VTVQMGLLFSAILFVGTHFLLSHPLRARLAGAMGERAFQGFYSLVAIATLGSTIYFYHIIGREPQLWAPGEALWLGSILFVGSFVRNPALPGARGPSGAPHGVFAITRHPMMWGFASWAAVHLMIVATPKALVLDGAILFLALAGSAGQDRKNAARRGERWHEWTAQTAFVPFTRGLASPGLVAFLGGTALLLLASWLHPGHAAGPWRWIG
jgi:uncharacterized membrane protein